jgi:hypothetical protein
MTRDCAPLRPSHTRDHLLGALHCGEGTMQTGFFVFIDSQLLRGLLPAFILCIVRDFISWASAEGESD